MSHDQTRAETRSLLQDLGLKEYEARCFLALTQVHTATAKELAELSEVPRTRIYDAVRVLESQGLVEVQHGSPQRFRAVSIEEGAATLRQRYDDRIDALQRNLESLDVETKPDESDRLQEVWSLSGAEAVQSRMVDLIENAESEIALVVVEEELLTPALFDRLHDAVDRGVDVVIGGKTDAIVSQLDSELPSVSVFETDLSWLIGPERENEVAISRIVLVDRETLLVSSFHPYGDGDATEQAVFASGLENGIVVLLRRLLSAGLLPSATPAG